jgi:hypothetical protein
MLTQTFVAGMTLAFRSRYKPLVLPIPTHDKFLIHDRWIVLLVGAVAAVDFIDRPLVSYRQHGRQQIGAHRLLGTTSAEAPSRRERAEHYRAATATLRLIQSRVDEFQAGGLPPGGRAALNSFATHLEARASMLDGRGVSAGLVLRELVSLRYFRHSRGVLSAIKDLLG